MIDKREVDEKSQDTARIMKNLDMLLKFFSVTKKEVEDGVRISSGYLTKLANPNNRKNVSFDLEIAIEDYLGIPPLSLGKEELVLPNNEDDFLIKVLNKLLAETKRGDRVWDEIEYTTLLKKPYWNELFEKRIADESPFQGEEDLVRKRDDINCVLYMPGSLYETRISDEQKIVIFATGRYTGDYDIDEDMYGNQFAYRILDWHYEVLMQTADGKYHPVVEDYGLNVKKNQILIWAIIRLYKYVSTTSKSKESRETMDALKKYLED